MCARTLFRAAPKRRGFTLVELLVVIAIIGTLVALLIPAVTSSLETARKTQCLSNMQQLGLAITNFANNNAGGTLPGYVQPVERTDNGNKRYLEWGATAATAGLSGSKVSSTSDFSQASRERSRISWAAHILPHLERQDIWDRMTDGSNSPPNGDVVKPIEPFLCPDDTELTSARDNAGLSYVANSGAWDWKANAANFDASDFFERQSTSSSPKGDSKHNGMFTNLTLGSVNVRLSKIDDGAATTLMLSENVQKNLNYSWMGVSATQGGEQQFGMDWVVAADANVQSDPANGIYHVTATPMSGTDFSLQVQEPINRESIADFRENAPRFARPTSKHAAGSVNVIFADGHGSSLQPTIDYLVYQQLLTPNGAKCVDPSDWNTIPAAINAYRKAPLISEKDIQ